MFVNSVHQIKSPLTQAIVGRPGNNVCADCRVTNPRWASWDRGIFLCVQCAGLHRKLGTHLTKVKSLTLDTWTKPQVDVSRTMASRGLTHQCIVIVLAHESDGKYQK